MNSQKTAKKRSSIALIMSSVLLVLILVAGGLYLFRYAGLEMDHFHPTPFSPPDSLEIPMRPGVQGIVISGPPLRDLYFKINLRAAGIQPINWSELEIIDPTGEVTVQARVTKSGDLQFNRRDDVKDAGHPDAGRYIVSKLSTWSYEPHKSGWIRFYFNVASRGRKLIIDDRDLQKNSDIPDKIRVRDGTMHYIDGLESTQVGIGIVSF